MAAAKPNPEPISGKVFGRWTVLETYEKRSGGRFFWDCRCQCGTMRAVVESTLISGRSLSCGCINAERQAAMIERRFGLSAATLKGCPCVYAIECIASGQVYIGSTGILYNRLRVHEKELNRGTHHSDSLQRAWDSHGKAGFRYVILEDNPTEPLKVREQFWIDAKRSYDPQFGFNVCPLSTSTRGAPIAPLNREAHAREFVVISPDGIESLVVNMKEFCRNNGLSISGMYAVANGHVANHRGWHCRRSNQTYEAWVASHRRCKINPTVPDLRR